MDLSRSFRFWFKLFLFIPFIICSIFIFYHFLVNRSFRRNLSNHIIIFILILIFFIQLTYGIWVLYFYQVGNALSSTPIFCRIWRFMDFYILTAITILVSWASVERHILIFHNRWLSTRRRRFLIHYFPLILCAIYPAIFYTIMSFILSCNQKYDYTILLCGNTYCFYETQIGLMWNNIVNNLIPASIIVIFSIGLLVRVIWQKHGLRGRVQWRNYRVMTIQLLSISAFYFILYIPSILLNTAYTFGLSPKVGADYYSFIIYFSYNVTMFIPIVFALSLSEFRAKLRIFIHCFRRPERAVGPAILHADHVMINRTGALIPTI